MQSFRGRKLPACVLVWLPVACNHNLFAPATSRVAVFDLERGRGIHILRGLVGQIARIRCSPDERLLAALSNDCQVAIWSLEPVPANGSLVRMTRHPRSAARRG